MVNLNIGFYIDTTNDDFINIIYNYAVLNERVLQNKSIILFSIHILKDRPNLLELLNRYKIIPILNFNDINYYINKHGINFIYQLAELGKTELLFQSATNCIHFSSPSIKETNARRVATFDKSSESFSYLPPITDMSVEFRRYLLKNKLKIHKNSYVISIIGRVHVRELINAAKANPNIFFLLVNVDHFEANMQNVLKINVDDYDDLLLITDVLWFDNTIIENVIYKNKNIIVEPMQDTHLYKKRRLHLNNFKVDGEDIIHMFERIYLV